MSLQSLTLNQTTKSMIFNIIESSTTLLPHTQYYTLHSLYGRFPVQARVDLFLVTAYSLYLTTSSYSLFKLRLGDF